MFDTKIAIIIRDDLAKWQKLNVRNQMLCQDEQTTKTQNV